MGRIEDHESAGYWEISESIESYIVQRLEYQSIGKVSVNVPIVIYYYARRPLHIVNDRKNRELGGTRKKKMNLFGTGRPSNRKGFSYTV